MVRNSSSTSKLFTVSAKDRPDASLVTRLIRARSINQVWDFLRVEANRNLAAAFKVEEATEQEIKELIEAKVRIEVVEKF